MATLPPPVALSEIHCPEVSAETLIEIYDVLLLDAYGVLVHSTAALPGAAAFLAKIRAANKEFFVVTNDASKLPSTSAATFASYGLDISADQIITSGSLLEPFFETMQLRGSRCVVLGPEDSVEYVRRAGGHPVALSRDADFDAVVICDDAGFPFLETMDMLLSNLCRHFDRGDAPRLILPNPDIMYPSGTGYGFASGAAALMIEAALGQRYPDTSPSFARLGKPFGPMFREVQRRTGSENMIMIGDQIDTDIVGARGLGIDAALVDTGIARWDQTMVDPSRAPTYRLSAIG